MPSRIEPAPTSAARTRSAPRASTSSEKASGQPFLNTLSTARQQKSRAATSAEADAPARKAAEMPARSRSKEPHGRAQADDAAPVETSAEVGPMTADGAAAAETPTQETEIQSDHVEVDAAPEAQKDADPASKDSSAVAVAPAATVIAGAAGAEQAATMAPDGETLGPAGAAAAGAIDLSGLVEAEEEDASAPAAAGATKALPRPTRRSQGKTNADAGGSQSERQGTAADPLAAIASTEGMAGDAAPADGEADVLAQAKPQAAAVASAEGASSLTTTPTGEAPRAGDAPKPAAPTPAPPAPTPARFAELNHSRIVTAARAELLPNGGTMQIKLDPPELGALQVSVRMLDGVMTASFQTSNDDATRLLSHSLAQLKHVLESQGVTVDKLQVQQAPRDQQTSNDEQRQQQRDEPWDESARHEQQRKEMLRRMWRRLAIGSDPLDLVA